MRVRILAVAMLALAASHRGGCRGDEKYDPCAGKACGSECRICDPSDASCSETAELKLCHPDGRCVSAGAEPIACPMPDPCAGKTCGEDCLASLPCHLASPPCEAPQAVGRCDAAGACRRTDVAVCPHPDCAGKACGAECNPCGPGAVCPTFVASACDRFGRCVGDVPGICDGPCAGKKCGEACDLCGGTCMHPYATACDFAGRCEPQTPWLCWDPCAGKACGESCGLCPPGAIGCVETANLKSCDAAGQCGGTEPACPP